MSKSRKIAVNEPLSYQYLCENIHTRNTNQILSLDQSNHYYGKDNSLIIRDEGANKYYQFYSYKHYLEWCEHHEIVKPQHHEVVMGNMRQKMKFDVEISADDLSAKKFNTYMTEDQKREHIHDTVLGIIYDIILSMTNDYSFNKEDIIVADSSDDTKFSRHYILPYYVNNNVEAKYVFDKIVEYIPDYIRYADDSGKEIIDSGVYKSAQNFRMIGSYKKDRVFRIISENHKLIDAVITHIEEYNKQLMAAEEHMNDDKYRTKEVKINNDGASALTNDQVHEILAIAKPHTESFTFVRIKNNRLTFRRKEPSHCDKCERTHNNDNTMSISVYKNGAIYLNCYHYKGDKKFEPIGHINGMTNAIDPNSPEYKFNFEKHVRGITHIENNNVPKSFAVNTMIVPELNEMDFHNDKYDTLIIKSNMGTGKSKRLRELISRPEINAMRIIIVSCRRSLTQETKRLLPEFTDYQTVKGDIRDKHIIVQVESLHRLMPTLDDTPTLLILDESESVITQFEHVNQVGKIASVWSNFEYFIGKSKYVIAMDANISKITYDLIHNTRKSVLVNINTFSRPSKDVYYEKYEALLKEIQDNADDIKGKGRFVVVTNSKKQAHYIFEQCKLYGPPNIVIQLFTGDSNNKNELKDFDLMCSNTDILIYTSTISAGLSYEKARFTNVYCYFTNMSADYKTCIQMIGRVRDISSRTYHIYINYSSCNMPNNIQDIERIMMLGHNIADVNYSDITVKEKRDDKFNAVIDSKCKDAYYWMRVNNILNICRSRNNFLREFRKLRISGGAHELSVIMGMNGMSADDVSAIAESLKEFRVRWKQEKINVIANANVISDEMAEDYKNRREELKAHERAGLAKYNLSMTYGIPIEKITVDFTAVYDNPRVKAVYRNLNRMRDDEVETATKLKSICDRLSAMKDAMKFHNISVTDFAIMNFSSVRLIITNEILGRIDPRYLEDIGRNFSSYFTHKATMIIAINECIDYLNAHIKTINYIFGCKSKATKDLNSRNIREKMQFINSLIYSTYGIKFKVKNDLYKLHTDPLFDYNPEYNRWMVPKMWTSAEELLNV